VKKTATKMTESKTEVPSSSTLKVRVRKAATKLPEAIQPDSVSAHPLADVSDAKARRKPKLETVPVPVPVPAPLPDVVPKSVTLPDVPVPHVLVRSARPSSRLVQLTVPSMAQSVASNAAKASFTRMTSLEPITPPMVGMIKKDNKLAHNWKKKPVQDLTDADVLAMPDDEYMNDTQLAFFRLKLVKLKTDMLSNAGETSEHLREETVIVPDPTDRATIEEEHALELRTRDRERKLLKKIDQSIASVDAGTYGFCEETGENIGVGRLLARPTAHLSLEAQQRRELKQKMFGD
jgi:DnaK suppressor protein